MDNLWIIYGSARRLDRPLWKRLELVSWDDETPNWMEKTNMFRTWEALEIRANGYETSKNILGYLQNVWLSLRQQKKKHLKSWFWATKQVAGHRSAIPISPFWRDKVPQTSGSIWANQTVPELYMAPGTAHTDHSSCQFWKLMTSAALFRCQSASEMCL